MKKSMPLLIILAIVITFVGCATNTAPGTTGAVDFSETGSSQNLETADTNTVKQSENSTEESVETAIVTEEIVLEPVNITVENMRPILLENEFCNVYLSSFGYANNETVFETHFLLENKSDMEISVVLTDVVVDGFDISTSQGKSMVSPDHKAICDSSVWESDLEAAGITEWTYLEGNVIVRQDYFGETLFSIPVTIDKACWEYEETYSAENPITVIVPSDLLTIPENAVVLSADNLYPTIVNTDGITVSISSYGYANGGTVFELNFVLENNTEQEISVLLTDVVIEGYEISTSQGNMMVEPGHKAICNSSVWQNDLDAVGITDWIVLTGNIEVREGYFGDTLQLIPVVIYKDAWEATN